MGDRAFSQAQRELPDPFPGADQESPWQDRELLRRVYHDLGFSSPQIAKGWDCSTGTISKWFRLHDIDTRSRSEAAQHMHGYGGYVSYRTRKSDSYESWRHLDSYVMVHRLQAVAEFGFEPVCNMEVHHKSEIPWDNRPENLELLTTGEHSSTHRKVNWLDGLRMAELYEEGAASSHTIGDHFDVASGTVMRYYREGYEA